jgi:hypothetical protein
MIMISCLLMAHAIPGEFQECERLQVMKLPGCQ